METTIEERTAESVSFCVCVRVCLCIATAGAKKKNNARQRKTVMRLSWIDALFVMATGMNGSTV